MNKNDNLIIYNYEITSKKHYCTWPLSILFLFFWGTIIKLLVIDWFMVGIYYAIVNKTIEYSWSSIFGLLFIIFWSVFLIMFVANLILSFFWEFWGKEIIQISRNQFIIKYNILFDIWEKKYDLRNIDKFAKNEIALNKKWYIITKNDRFARKHPGKIIFNYNGKLKDFAEGLSKVKISEIVYDLNNILERQKGTLHLS